MELVIGDKAWSSWSLRPWLALKRTGAPFTETLIPLRQPDTKLRILRKGGLSGQVPVLIDKGHVVWDSLAICEYLADKFPEAELWPTDMRTRALARSACAEMHSGFAALRTEMPMDLKLKARSKPSPSVEANIRRIVQIWWLMWAAADETEGPWLLGKWSIADAMFAPVCTRFRTYGVDLTDYGDDDGVAADYVETALADSFLKEWEAAA